MVALRGQGGNSQALTRYPRSVKLPTMPKQRWRHEVLSELRNHGAVLTDAVERQDKTIRWLGEQHRAAIRDLKASVDRNTEVTDRSMNLLEGLIAEVRHSSAKTDDLMHEIKAQTSALLILVDEIRGRN